MTQIRIALAVVTGLGCMVLSVGCASPSVLEPSPSAPTPSPQSTEELTSLIASLLVDAGWVGREVTVVGYYRGWDLLGEVNQSPPVTRSDWVIKDRSGALYVQINDVGIEGLDRLAKGETLQPGDKGCVERVLRVTGIVRLAHGVQRYIEPTRLELLW